MPGRTEKAAHAAFLEPLLTCLGAITWNRALVDDKPIAVDVQKSLTLPATELKGALADGGVPRLFVGIRYSIVRDDEARSANERFRVTTAQYMYHVTSSLSEEVLLYHWHPAGKVRFPHLHLGKDQVAASAGLPSGAHVPTARVALESVVLFLIDELGVTPTRPNFRGAINANLEKFIKYRTWHG